MRILAWALLFCAAVLTTACQTTPRQPDAIDAACAAMLSKSLTE